MRRVLSLKVRCTSIAPIGDLMGFYFRAASYLGSRILWRGRVFQLLPGGRMRSAE